MLTIDTDFANPLVVPYTAHLVVARRCSAHRTLRTTRVHSPSRCKAITCAPHASASTARPRTPLNGRELPTRLSHELLRMLAAY